MCIRDSPSAIANGRNSTTVVASIEANRGLAPQLEKALREIEFSSEQSLNEMNHLFNEVDSRRKRREIPEYLTCKLCYDLMRDPVITPCKSIACSSRSNRSRFSWHYLLSIVHRREPFQSRSYGSDRQQTSGRRTTGEQFSLEGDHREIHQGKRLGHCRMFLISPRRIKMNSRADLHISMIAMFNTVNKSLKAHRNPFQRLDEDFYRFNGKYHQN